MSGVLAIRLGPVLERIPLLRRFRRERPDRKLVLRALPVRNRLLEWAEDEQQLVTLRVPKRQGRWFRLLERVVSVPEHRQVLLDEVGSDVWRLCDGETSIDAMIQALAKKYRLNRREVEVSLSLYLKQLAKRGYVGLLAPAEGTQGLQSASASQAGKPAPPPGRSTPSARKTKCKQRARSGRQHRSG